jgi:hypothetical protein
MVQFHFILRSNPCEVMIAFKLYLPSYLSVYTMPNTAG